MIYYPITIDGVAYPTKAALNSTFGAMNDNVTLYTDSSAVVRGVKIRSAQKIFNAKQEENTMGAVRHFLGNSNRLIHNGFMLSYAGSIKGEDYCTEFVLEDDQLDEVNFWVGELKKDHEQNLLDHFHRNDYNPASVVFLNQSRFDLINQGSVGHMEIVQIGNRLISTTKFALLHQMKVDE